MIPTFVFGWPTSQEKGDFLAVDLGTFILSVSLLDSNGFNVNIQVVPIFEYVW